MRTTTTTRTPSRVYWLLLVAGFQRRSRYRAAMWSSLGTNIVFGLIRASVLGAAATAAGGELAGYSTAALMTFVWVGQALLGSVNLWGRTDLTESIRTGDITSDFLRPISVVGSYLARDVGGALFVLVPRGVPALLVGWVTFGLASSSDPLNWVLAVPSVLTAIVVSHLAVYAVALLGFWVVETRGLMMVYALVASFLAGLTIPVRLFPGWLLTLANCTPFPSMLQAPIDILTGRVVGSAAVGTLATQLGWTIVMTLLVAAISHAGRRHLEVQGG